MREMGRGLEETHVFDTNFLKKTNCKMRSILQTVPASIARRKPMIWMDLHPRTSTVSKNVYVPTNTLAPLR